ncbi:(+)-neomenthol dehydrogenase -like protein [Gossypium arboreum]|uniref:Short-chain dehydrogenase/reductase n=1 Tax=Gossypium arboreum TaxID=29729 RepID=A0A0B0NP93_GOSAR|nr:(+)-neomenthol dehydrogenase -like protein [Gossypium arboreum]
MTDTMQRYAVVTGANKGIGLEICKQLAQNGTIVILTARDAKRGVEALQSLKHSGLSDRLAFHQLDVTKPKSIASLADFIKEQFGKLDILVNNAGISGVTFSMASGTEEYSSNIWSKATETYELAEECLKTNYYGAKRTTEALIPLLQISESPRIVNISSSIVMLKDMVGEQLKGVLTGFTTEEKLSDLISEYLKDFKQGLLQTKGWPTCLSAYTVSKVAMNAYTRIVANKYPDFCINCVCPGFVKTDINLNTGKLTVEEGAATPVKLAVLPKGGPSGLFFVRGEPASPDLDDGYIGR